VFGSGYSRSLASDLVLGALDGRTVDAALAAGVPPRDVWVALCDATDVPEERRWGQQRRRRHGRSA
jgi:hypothetical protein